MSDPNQSDPVGELFGPLIPAEVERAQTPAERTIDIVMAVVLCAGVPLLCLLGWWLA